MKLASLYTSHKDGELIVVSKDGKKALKPKIAEKTLREAIENWSSAESKLKEAYELLNSGEAGEAFDLDVKKLHSPLPRAFQWLDGSAFLYHVELVRKARNAEMPEKLYEVPLMYQGVSDEHLGPYQDIPQVNFSHGTDFEAEVGVILNDTPMGVKPEEALKHVMFVVILNDVSLRGLIPQELGMGFGFVQSKPASSYAPFALTPDELGSDWKDGRLHLPMNVEYNGEFFGKANAGEMHFGFAELIAHAAKTRNLRAGTIIGSGTVSNNKEGVGSSCLAEKRMIEKIETGEFKTPFMKDGDTVKISMADQDGNDLFGEIFQTVRKTK